ncbi:HNH endonuclease signature motif containing protein, partial [Escherichia coli]|uniref:HNH endonuclease signature motif containing protein n=1 Tax=Escherichia coli TaxID=562 RepID=UPI003CE4C1A5
RVALAIRDGGCVWPDCTRPAAYCEAHPADHYSEGGCTDIDRGVLLCRFHHMLLHNRGWRLLRDGKDPFRL